MDDVELQQKYYKETAKKYNEHVHTHDEHAFALSFLVSILDYFEIKSILDVGAGTGRTVLYIKSIRPDITITGIEPIKELREVGYKNGLTNTEMLEGNATSLNYSNNKFDLVCEFGMLHHVKNPKVVVSEMLRVGKKAVFISDSNNFGQGSPVSRFIKQTINLFGLWPVANLIKTKGKGYRISEGDGISFSYSVFDNYKQISKQCKRVHIVNTVDGHINTYRTASHAAILGIKECVQS